MIIYLVSQFGFDSKKCWQIPFQQFSAISFSDKHQNIDILQVSIIIDIFQKLPSLVLFLSEFSLLAENRPRWYVLRTISQGWNNQAQKNFTTFNMDTVLTSLLHVFYKQILKKESKTLHRICLFTLHQNRVTASV